MGNRILVVDDEAALVELLAVNLELEGFQVARAHDGEEGLSAAVSERPDVVLLDVRMPGIDGFEVCRRLKESPATKDIPVIMVSAYAQPADVERGFLLGAADYVKKPFDVTELVPRIRAVLPS
jgi:DNA-binding response OmpR family regulator